MVKDLSSLQILSDCLESHYKLVTNIMQKLENENNNNKKNEEKHGAMTDKLLILLMSIRLNPSLKRTHCNILHKLQFNAMNGILSQINIVKFHSFMNIHEY